MPSPTLSVVVPCFNEAATLAASVTRLVAAFRAAAVELEVLIVDDGSTDSSRTVAEALTRDCHEVRLFCHEANRGKGAALRTGFAHARGAYVAVHDADLEYDPADLIRLLAPLERGDADVVYGSRYRSGEVHRVLYFWHSVGNQLLTLLSNMFTDLSLSDVETCYKVFRRDIIQGIELVEDRFGFEIEVTARVASLRPRVCEMGISYNGRTYEEGKKIGFRDALRALYCIVRYNAHRAPVALQFLVYLFVGGTAAIANLLLFTALRGLGAGAAEGAAVAFAAAAALNYWLCITVLFRHQARWQRPAEVVIYCLGAAVVGAIDVSATTYFVSQAVGDTWAKTSASVIGVLLNFSARRWVVFPEPGRGPWKPTRG